MAQYAYETFVAAKQGLSIAQLKAAAAGIMATPLKNYYAQLVRDKIQARRDAVEAKAALLVAKINEQLPASCEARYDGWDGKRIGFSIGVATDG